MAIFGRDRYGGCEALRIAGTIQKQRRRELAGERRSSSFDRADHGGALDDFAPVSVRLDVCDVAWRCLTIDRLMDVLDLEAHAPARVEARRLADALVSAYRGASRLRPPSRVEERRVELRAIGLARLDAIYAQLAVQADHELAARVDTLAAAAVAAAFDGAELRLPDDDLATAFRARTTSDAADVVEPLLDAIRDLDELGVVELAAQARSVDSGFVRELMPAGLPTRQVVAVERAVSAIAAANLERALIAYELRGIGGPRQHGFAVPPLFPDDLLRRLADVTHARDAAPARAGVRLLGDGAVDELQRGAILTQALVDATIDHRRAIGAARPLRPAEERLGALVAAVRETNTPPLSDLAAAARPQLPATDGPQLAL